MKKIKFIIISFFLTIYFNNSYSLSIQIIAKVENEIITNIDIEHEKRYLTFLNPNLEELQLEKKNEIAKNSLITEIVKKKELEKFFNFDESKNIIKIVEENFLKKKKIKNKEEFLNILKNRNLNYSKISAKLQIEGLWNQLVFKKFSKNVKIDRENLKQNIIKQFENTEKKFEYNLSEIVFQEKTNEGLEKIMNKISNSILENGFENSANIYSISNTSTNGGLIGWVNELQISRNINENIKNLKIGSISKPIKISGGYLLIKINNKKELKQEINLEKQLEKLVSQEQNRQLNNFSIIFYKKLKKNLEINEY